MEGPTKSNAGRTVFYAWQSVIKPNRSFVERALREAIEQLRRELSVEESPRLDHDTKGEPGSPDIVATILEKIDRCSVFVADVTLTGSEGGRGTPNPNVLFELGYAQRAVGTPRVILVQNETTGRPEGLPFDLRNRRVMTFNALPETDNADARRLLIAKLRDALKVSLEALPKPQPEPSADVVRRLMNEGRLPIVSVKAMRFPAAQTKGVVLQNISNHAALDMKLALVLHNEILGREVGDVPPGEERTVQLVYDDDPWPLQFDVMFATPSGHRLTQQFLADGNQYRRTRVLLRDQSGFQIG